MTQIMNLADPELELVDPTPNVHSLFIHFDKLFFMTKLANRAVVRWSKRMYSCAGICSYEGHGGLCDIALSEPLLKLRPRKDLIQTLLHEMIHAFLFVTSRDQDRDGHGPNFKAHMHRINRVTGLHISIYHDFHDEVKLYLTHWWRCNGPCQTRRPHFGIVRRSMNKAPGPTDYWWRNHMSTCGGTFVKIKEPENKKTNKSNTNKTKNNVTAKPNADITKYININGNIKTINTVSKTNTSVKPVLKNSNIMTSFPKTNSNSTVVVSKRGVVYNPTVIKPSSQPVPVFTGSGHTINDSKHVTDYRSVTEIVRSIWANYQIPTPNNKAPTKNLESSTVNERSKIADTSNPKKHKAETTNSQCPPAKITKIDDYFKATAKSLLKDVYGEDFKLTQPHNSTKLVAVSVKLVDCPVCSAKVDSKDINRHLDECLNKEVIEKLSKDSEIMSKVSPSQSNNENNKLKQVVADMPSIPPFKGKPESTNNNVVDLTNLNHFFDFDTFNDNEYRNRRKTESQATLQSVDTNKATALAKQIQNEKNNKNTTIDPSRRNRIHKPTLNNIRKSENFVTKDRGDEICNNIKESGSATNDNPEPSTSKESEPFEQKCPCCGAKFDKPVDEHLDECLAFFENQATIPSEGASTSSSGIVTIVVDDDDDIFDESQVLNATGTKTPCPCCMQMVEEAAMNDHLDICLE